MLVDSSMATLSDLTFRTAFVIYIAALVMSCIYYGRLLGVIDLRREREERAAAGVRTAPAQQRIDACLPALRRMNEERVNLLRQCLQGSLECLDLRPLAPVG